MIPFEDGLIDPQKWGDGIWEYCMSLREHEAGEVAEERECLFTLGVLKLLAFHRLGDYIQGNN